MNQIGATITFIYNVGCILVHCIKSRDLTYAWNKKRHTIRAF